MTNTAWRDAAIVGLVVLGLACGFVWLVLWADARKCSICDQPAVAQFTSSVTGNPIQRCGEHMPRTQSNEPRNWVG